MTKQVSGWGGSLQCRPGSRLRSLPDKASEWVGGPSSGAVIGDLVDAAAWGVVPCVSKIYTLRIEVYGCIRCKLWCHDVVFYF